MTRRLRRTRHEMREEWSRFQRDLVSNGVVCSICNGVPDVIGCQSNDDFNFCGPCWARVPAGSRMFMLTNQNRQSE